MNMYDKEYSKEFEKEISRYMYHEILILFGPAFKQGTKSKPCNGGWGGGIFWN